jgi:hypothetical protein
VIISYTAFNDVFLMATHFVLCEVRTESLYITQIYICLHGINVTLHFMVIIILRPHSISLSFILLFNHSIDYLSLLSIFLCFVSYLLILGEFAKLRKATVSFVTSVRLSVCQSIRPSARNNAAPIGRIVTNFYEYISKICQGNSSFFNIWQK